MQGLVHVPLLDLNSFKSGNPFVGSLMNSEDPDQTPHKVAFHQGPYCLLRQDRATIGG